MNRKLTAIALTAITILALTGCTESGAGETEGVYEVIHVDVDGRKVPCVVWDGYKAGGITCDWNAKS